MTSPINFSDVDLSPYSGQGGAMLLNPKIGFELGWDYAMYGLQRGGELPVSFRRGQEAGKKQAGARPLKSDPFIRKWLQVRYNAWLRGRAVDEQVTPAFIAKIDRSRCPVRRVEMTKGALADSDWSIDRLNNDGAYAVGNLAVMSVKANHAKADKAFKDILDCATGSGEVDGLSPREWMRMAVMCLAPCEDPGAGEVPVLPMVTFPPPFVPIHLSQQAQLILAQQSYGGKGTVIGRLREIAASGSDSKRFHRLIQRLRKHNSPIFPVEAWEDPRTFELYKEWYLSLQVSGREKLMRTISNQGGFTSMPSGFRQAWLLESKGYA